MGLGCSKSKDSVPVGVSARLSPFGRFTRRNSIGARIENEGLDSTLVKLSVDAACQHLHTLPINQLRALPTDLCQLILERLIDTGRLNDAAILRLQGAGFHFHSFRLDAYSEPIRDFWLRYLATTSLEVAVIRRSTIDDQVLTAMPYLPKLHTLDLDYCPGITDAGLSTLRGLPQLKDLSIAGCDGITHYGILEICHLANLTSLNLEQCHRISGLNTIRNLALLKHLNLGWCSNIGNFDAEAIGQLANLTDLKLCNTRVGDTGLAHLHSLTLLKSLSLKGLGVSDAAVAQLVSKLPSLAVFDVERCGRVDDDTLRALGQHCWATLEDLNVAYTAISDDGLNALYRATNLSRLNLDSCGIGDRGLEVVEQFGALESLDLSDTSVTAASMSNLKKLKHLVTLNLSFTGVDNHGLKKVAAISSLQRLNLDSRQFSDAGMEYVARLPNLKVLDLFGSTVTDAGCSHICRMTSLTSLELCSGVITDSGVAKLGVLTNLRHLNLGQNFRVSNSSIPHLLKLSQLTALNLSQCRITSTAIVALGCLTDLSVLALHGSKVRPIAVEKLRSMNPDLEVLGIRMPDV